MNGASTEIIVRDRRPRHWFWLDNIVIDQMASRLGPNGLSVYICLCRFANVNQKSWPSQKTIMEKCNMSEAAVRRSLRILEKCGMIETSVESGKSGYAHNIYGLLGTDFWCKPPVSQTAGLPKKMNEPPVSQTAGLTDRRSIKPAVYKTGGLMASKPPVCETGKEDNIEPANIPPNPQKGGLDFDGLWQQYPKRDGKKAAKRHFDASVKIDPNAPVRIQKALKKYLEYLRNEKIEPKFIKNGSTWFNNWEDWENYSLPLAVQESSEARTKRLLDQGLCPTCRPPAKIEFASEEYGYRCVSCNHQYFKNSNEKNPIPKILEMAVKKI